MKTILSAASVLACAGVAFGQTANFDSQSEGTFGTTITDAGFTFHDMDMRFPGENPPFTMTIEDASADLGGMTGFSSPNVMGFGGYSPGPGAGFGRFGSVRITPPAPAGAASIEVFEFGSDPATLVLAGYSGGQEVSRATVSTLPCCGIHHYRLTISGPTFDELRLFVNAPADAGVIFGLVDNITVGAGEPACYVNCDNSTSAPFLNVLDFNCFVNRFIGGDSYANCDGSTIAPVLNVLDFNCFINRFSNGCSAP